jgi:hypothetical protein
MALADSVIGELHLLEQMSSDEHLGSLAEAVLEAVKGHPEAARRVDQVRHNISNLSYKCIQIQAAICTGNQSTRYLDTVAILPNYRK